MKLISYCGVALGLAIYQTVSMAAPEAGLPAVGYTIKTGEFTSDRQMVYSPYAKGKDPFDYLDRIVPPPPAPPKYLVLDIYTQKLFLLPPLAPTIYRNGDRYSLTHPHGWNDADVTIGMGATQFLDLGVMYARYVPEAIAPPIHFARGDADESRTKYDPSAPPEFMVSSGWQSADIYKDIDKTSEASLPLYGNAFGDKVHRTSIVYTKAAVAYKGFALSATWLESTEFLHPRKATLDALADLEAAEIKQEEIAAHAALESALKSALAEAQRLGINPTPQQIAATESALRKEFMSSQKGGVGTGDADLPHTLPHGKIPPARKYEEIEIGLTYSHEIVPGLFDATIGYTAFFIPDTDFWGTGFVGEFDAKIAYKQLPHMRPNVTFSLFNSGAEQLRGKSFDFRWDTYGLTIFQSEKFKTRVEFNPYVAVGVDYGLIGDGIDWTAVRIGARMPIYIGRHANLNLDINYAFPINGHSDSEYNFRTDLGEVGPWGGVSFSYRF